MKNLVNDIFKKLNLNDQIEESDYMKVMDYLDNEFDFETILNMAYICGYYEGYQRAEMKSEV